jgi:hypothetical protein
MEVGSPGLLAASTTPQGLGALSDEGARDNDTLAANSKPGSEPDKGCRNTGLSSGQFCKKVESQFGTSALSLVFGKAGDGTIFFNLPVMFPGEYTLCFAQSSTNRFTRIAPSNIPAIVFL